MQRRRDERSELCSFFFSRRAPRCLRKNLRGWGMESQTDSVYWSARTRADMRWGEVGREGGCRRGRAGRGKRAKGEGGWGRGHRSGPASMRRRRARRWCVAAAASGSAGEGAREGLMRRTAQERRTRTQQQLSETRGAAAVQGIDGRLAWVLPGARPRGVALDDGGDRARLRGRERPSLLVARLPKISPPPQPSDESRGKVLGAPPLVWTRRCGSQRRTRRA